MPNIFAQPYFTGTPLGTLTFYSTGTLVLATIYSDASATIALPNPLTADAEGRYPEIYLADGITYRMIERDADGVTLADVDPINPPLGLNSLQVATDGTFGGRVRAVTPDAGTQGGFQLVASPISNFGYVQILDPTSVTEWGNWRYDNTGLARWSGAMQVIGALTVGGALASGSALFTGSARTTPVAVTVAATTTINVAQSNIFTLTMTTSITTLTINNAVEGQSIGVLFKQDGAGSRTVAWPASFRWASGSAPTLSTAGGARDFLSAQFIDGVWIAALLKGAA
jgi:hypothetical protein